MRLILIPSHAAPIATASEQQAGGADGGGPALFTPFSPLTLSFYTMFDVQPYRQEAWKALFRLPRWFKMNLNRATAFWVLYSLASVTWAASPGSLDTSFAVGLGSSYGDNVVMVQTNGQVVIAGDFSSYHFVTRFGIARLNSDASLDFAFDPTNNVAGSVKAGALLSDGRIVVAGGFTIGSANRNRVARLNNDGKLDSSFDPGVGPNNDVRCLAVQADGKIVIGGRFTSVAGQTRNYIARLNSDGSLDTNFVAAADYFVDTLAIQPDGKILVGGWFFHLNGTSPPNLARLNADGTLDTGFAPSVNAPVETIAVQADGRIIIGGYSTFATGAQVSRLMPNGTWDSSFVPQVSGAVYVVCLQDDGKILVGGNMSPHLARLYSDGSTDGSFSSGADNIVQRLALAPDGRIVIAGGFGYVEGVLEQGLARLYGDDRNATPVIEINGKAFQAWQSDASVSVPVLRSGNTNTTVSVQYATADFDAQAGSDYVATSGTLIFLPGEVTKSVAVPLLNDGQVDNSERFGIFLTNASGGVLGASTNATITILGVNNVVQISTPDIVTNELAGALSVTLSRVGTNVASSVSCQTVDGTAVVGINYSNLAQVVSFAPGQAVQTVSITLLDDALPGPDTFFGVVLTNSVSGQIGARSNLTVTVLDNDAPGHPAFGLSGRVNAVTSTADGAVVLGGSFSTINGTSRNGIGKAHADETLDQSFDPGTGANPAVSAVLVQQDGKLVCGGTFSSYNGTPRVRLMRLNPDGSLDGSFNPGAGPNNAVTALAPSTNGAFFAGGWFTAYRDAPRPGVVEINADGSLNTNFVPQIPGTRLIVCCVATQSGGGLLVGLDSYVGLNTNLCVRLNPDGSLDTTFTNRIRGSFSQAQVQSIVVQSDGKILLGGYFASVNGVSRKNIARLNADGSLDTSFDPSSGANGPIYKLLLMDNGQIIATGSFSSYAGVSRNRIVRINANGSIDPAFDPSGGADSAIYDVARLPANRWAIGGTFRNFAGFPRYYFAVLTSNGQLATHIGFESFTAAGNLQFGMRIEPETPFQLLSSSNLVNWQVVYSNLLHQSFTNLVLPRTTQDRQFFRTWQGH